MIRYCEYCKRNPLQGNQERWCGKNCNSNYWAKQSRLNKKVVIEKIYDNSLDRLWHLFVVTGCIAGVASLLLQNWYPFLLLIFIYGFWITLFKMDT